MLLKFTILELLFKAYRETSLVLYFHCVCVFACVCACDTNVERKSTRTYAIYRECANKTDCPCMRMVEYTFRDDGIKTIQWRFVHSRTSPMWVRWNRQKSKRKRMCSIKTFYCIWALSRENMMHTLTQCLRVFTWIARSPVCENGMKTYIERIQAHRMCVASYDGYVMVCVSVMTTTTATTISWKSCHTNSQTNTPKSIGI